MCKRSRKPHLVTVILEVSYKDYKRKQYLRTGEGVWQE